MFEIIVQLEDALGANETRMVDASEDAVGLQVGGPTLNVCWYLSRLGQDARLVGPCGRSDKESVLAHLRSIGIDPSHVVPSSTGTDYLCSFVEPSGHRSVYLRSKISPASTEEIICQCACADVLILNGSRHRLIRKAFTELASRPDGPMLVFNPSYAINEYEHEALLSLLARADLTQVNEHEAQYIVATAGLDSQKAIAGLTRGDLLITRAGKGAMAYSGGSGKGVSVPSVSAHDRDQVGCGDAFLAGHLHASCCGKDTTEAARFAAALAGIVAEIGRPRSEITEDDVRAKMQQEPR